MLRYSINDCRKNRNLLWTRKGHTKRIEKDQVTEHVQRDEKLRIEKAQPNAIYLMWRMISRGRSVLKVETKQIDKENMVISNPTNNHL